ncbi:hypothetical protein SAY87_007669 [Trapa incisa]|uniref:Uncharacterized protein n=1 Tax=Trapa incisa TaxID=236973 RepID=A0AAN7KN83_9MYRT|nr:hypothetical protein SAY87_007669 [Trapa incisa]
MLQILMSSLVLELFEYYGNVSFILPLPLVAKPILIHFISRLFPQRPTMSKTLMFVYAGNVTYTKGQFKAMAASAFPMHSNKAGSAHFFSMLVSPREVILGSDLLAQMYCHLLCGLRNFDLVDNIRAPYAAGLVRALSLLQSKWEQLCNDLESGTPSIDMSESEMSSMTELLRGPQPELSQRVRSICKDGIWDGIMIKLWPNLRYIKCVTTGSMLPYYSKLKQYAGSVPILGGDYFSSECCVAINLDISQPPEKTRYVLLPTGAYFEFLPFSSLGCEASVGETVDISGVEVGKAYEVVVTTYRGFYRYRLGDIVRVVGFHNLSPELEFVTKAPKSPREILSEQDLISSMESLRALYENQTGVEIIEYAGFLDFDRFKIFVEVKDGINEKDGVLIGLCSSLEDSFGGIYKVQRDRGELKPLSMYIVGPGSFDRLLILVTGMGAPASQYKHPKLIGNIEVAGFLEGAALVAVQSR